MRYQSEVVELPLVIVSGDRPALLGRNWMEMMKFDWSSIRAVTLETGIASVDEIVNFQGGLREHQGFKSEDIPPTGDDTNLQESSPSTVRTT